jgi:hypothetical protein
VRAFARVFAAATAGDFGAFLAGDAFVALDFRATDFAAPRVVTVPRVFADFFRTDLRATGFRATGLRPAPFLAGAALRVVLLAAPVARFFAPADLFRLLAVADRAAGRAVRRDAFFFVLAIGESLFLATVVPHPGYLDTSS